MTPCSCSGGCQTDTMVRPRFFAGQLLTEDDLQSLEDYFLAKNRLHNRRLFGDGVVCGLEVLCHPCGGGKVVVQPGYALDCCGNDIVLSCKVELDINAMVRDLRQSKLGGYDCGDPCAPMTPAKGAPSTKTKPGDDCVREYCLYIHYCEEETEPVSPYSPDQPCTPSVCEPSRIREGLRFELRCPEKCRPPADFWAALCACLAKDTIGLESMTFNALAALDFDFGKLWERVRDCSKVKSAADLRDQLLALIERCPDRVSCDLRERICAVKLPPVKEAPTPGDKSPMVTPADEAAEKEAADKLLIILLEILRDCICMAVIPPCEDCADTGVLLACLKVKNCEVIEICNLARHFVLSPVAIRYWLGVGRLEDCLHQICCTDIGCWDAEYWQAKYAAVQAPAVPPQASLAADGTARPGQPSPPPGIAPAARFVQMAVLATEALQPPGSPDTPRLKNIAEYLGVLTGQPAGRDSGRDSPPISDSTFARLKERMQPELALGAQAMEMIATLRTEVAALQGEIKNLKKPAAEKPAPKRPAKR
jgi:hypothetical protein